VYPSINVSFCGKRCVGVSSSNTTSDQERRCNLHPVQNNHFDFKYNPSSPNAGRIDRRHVPINKELSQNLCLYKQRLVYSVYPSINVSFCGKRCVGVSSSNTTSDQERRGRDWRGRV
jgi:hypothetical protein